MAGLSVRQIVDKRNTEFTGKYHYCQCIWEWTDDFVWHLMKLQASILRLIGKPGLLGSETVSSFV